MAEPSTSAKSVAIKASSRITQSVYRSHLGEWYAVA
jgi:hypothetical protein